jgi:protein-tyrosine-phosphatase
MYGNICRSPIGERYLQIMPDKKLIQQELVL